MSEVKRYSPGYRDNYRDGGFEDCKESADGELVSYKDYTTLEERSNFKQNLTEQIVALQKQCVALAAENAALSRYFRSSAGAVENWNSWADAEDKLASVPETPATDAYLNSVRADAVVNAAAHLGDMAAGKSASTAELIKSCGRALLAFAAQLRAGKDGE